MKIGGVMIRKDKSVMNFKQKVSYNIQGDSKPLRQTLRVGRANNKEHSFVKQPTSFDAWF